MKNNISFVLVLIVFLSLSCNSTKKISFIQRADQIDIMAENQLITSYIYRQYHQKPIMHPVLSPSGEILTRGFPLTKVDARGYGCFAANPLGQFDFQKGTGIENPQRRNLTLKPGESALFKFRMIIYEGMRDKEKSDKDFKKYSKS